MRIFTVFLCASILPVAGCARSAEERQLQEMRDEITHIQQSRDREEARISELEVDVADSKAASAAAAPARSASAPPPAVAVGPDESVPAEAESPDTEDTSPRPTIRVFGSPRPTGRHGLGARGDDTIQETVPDDGGYGPAAAPRPSALDPEAKRAYDTALALVTGKRYEAALDALAAFLVKWPDHPYADNAMYWRGECYFARGDYVRAAEQFEGTVARFPAGNKAPDALLKLGITQMKLGNPTKAKEAFDQLAKQYPQSDAAKRIPPVTVPAATPPGPASEEHIR